MTVLLALSEKDLLPRIVHIDLAGLDETQAGERLLTGIERGRTKPGTAPSFPMKPVQHEESEQSAPSPTSPGIPTRTGGYCDHAWFIALVATLRPPQPAGAGRRQSEVAEQRMQELLPTLWMEAGSRGGQHRQSARSRQLVQQGLAV